MNASPESSKNSQKQTGFIADHELSSAADSALSKKLLNKSLDINRKAAQFDRAANDYDGQGGDENKSLAIS